MRIAVVALGKIGLPLAVHYAGKGHSVVGVDTDPAVVAAANAGADANALVSRTFHRHLAHPSSTYSRGCAPKPELTCANRHNSWHVEPLSDPHRPLLSNSTLQNCDTRHPHEHSFDTKASKAFTSGPILWTDCYDAKQ